MNISSFQCYPKNAMEFFVEVFVLNQKTIFVGASVMSRSRYQYKMGIKLKPYQPFERLLLKLHNIRNEERWWS